LKRKRRNSKKPSAQLLPAQIGFALLCVIAIGALYFYLFWQDGGYTFWQDGDYTFVHFIDVGQGDATLIQTPSGTMLIDGGDNHMGDTVVDYLLHSGVYFLDYVIATHPHADHIGGLISVLDSFPIGTLIMPNRAHTTLTFERFLDAIERNNVHVIEPIVGAVMELGDAVFTVVAPNSYGHAGLNDYSIVMHMAYGNVNFLFTGDAEAVSEREMLAYGHNISADILRVGHHGSSTSTIYEFLHEVDPIIAVISAGYGNPFGHPHNSVINRLYDRGVSIYRTDYHGHIVITTDGQNIWVN